MRRKLDFNRTMPYPRPICLICLASLLLLSACNRPAEPAVREMEVQAEDVTLHARVAGKPRSDEVLIAIHGGPGNSSDYMLSLETLQRDDLAIVTYDQRGTGRSSQPPKGYGLLEYVEDLEAVRKAIGSEQVHLLGHSWGGIVAMRYATVYPHRVRSIILMGSGPPDAADARVAQASLGQRVAQLQQQGVIASELPSNSGELLRAILPAYFSDAGFELPEALAHMSFNQAASDQTYADLGSWDFRAEVGRLEHAVLMLWGEDDPFGIAMAEATQSAMSSADVQFVVLDACGHFWHECPDAFFSQVRSFLASGSTP